MGVQARGPHYATPRLGDAVADFCQRISTPSQESCYLKIV